MVLSYISLADIIYYIVQRAGMKELLLYTEWSLFQRGVTVYRGVFVSESKNEGVTVYRSS